MPLAQKSKLLKTVFMGSPLVAKQMLSILTKNENILLQAVWTNPPKKSGRGLKETFTEVATYVREWVAKDLPKVYLREPKKIDEEEVQFLQNLSPDLIFVAAYGKILPQTFFSIPSLGSFNIHYSLLPQYRGASPVQSAILNQETESGITIQKINSRLDCGDILLQQKFSINGLTSEEVFQKSFQASKELIPQFIEDLLKNRLIYKAQNDSQSSYCSKINKQDGELITSDSAKQIYHKFLAYQPWPGIFFLKDNIKYEIKGLKIIEDFDFYNNESNALIGSLNKIKGKLLLQLHDRCLEITAIKKSGKRTLTSKDFLNGNKWVFPIYFH